MLLLAEVNAGRVEVQAGVLGGAEVAGDPGGSTAVTTAHFQNLLALKIDLGSDVMVKLDAGAVVFVTGLQFQADRGVGFKGVVEEQDTVPTKSASQKRVPKSPDGLADGGDGEKTFEEGHGAGIMGLDSTIVIRIVDGISCFAVAMVFGLSEEGRINGSKRRQTYS